MSDPMIEILNPTAEAAVVATALAPRLPSLQGKVVGTLSNIWRSYDLMLEHFENIAKSGYGVAEVVKISNPSLSSGTPAETLESLASKADAAIVGMGHCGSCAASSINDALIFEAKGIPTVVIITEPFRVLSETVARARGKPDLPLIVLPSTIEEISDDEISSMAKTTFERVAGLLTGSPGHHE